MADVKYRPAPRDHQHTIGDVEGLADAGDIDLTPALGGVTSGSVYLTRAGQQVWLDFQDVAADAQEGNTIGDEFFLRWQGVIPAGYRPPRVVDLPLIGRAGTLTNGPARVSTSGELVIYRHSGTVRGLVSWFTREALPA